MDFESEFLRDRSKIPPSEDISDRELGSCGGLAHSTQMSDESLPLLVQGHRSVQIVSKTQGGSDLCTLSPTVQRHDGKSIARLLCNACVG